MAAKWPQVTESASPAKKRGGGTYTQWKVRLTTEAPCREHVTAVARHPMRAQARALAQTEINAKMATHLRAHRCGS